MMLLMNWTATSKRSRNEFLSGDNNNSVAGGNTPKNTPPGKKKRFRLLMNARLIVILLTFSIPAVLGQCNGNNGQLNFGDPVSSGSGNYESNADCVSHDLSRATGHSNISSLCQSTAFQPSSAFCSHTQTLLLFFHVDFPPRFFIELGYAFCF